MVVANDGSVTPRPVVLGPLVDGLRVVRSGLTTADNVVIAGGQSVMPGIKVQVKKGVIMPTTVTAGPVSKPDGPSGQATFASR